MTEPALLIPPPNTSRWHLPVLLAVVLVVFGRSLAFGFVAWDDYGMVLDNPLLNPVTPQTLAAMWTGPVQGLYTPLAYTLWAGVVAIARTSADPAGGTLSPWPFHALNLVLHLGASAAAYGVLRRLARSPAAALAGAMLFALHPLKVEPVAWIAGMNNLLAGLFSLVAIGCYLRAVDDTEPDRSPGRMGWRLAAAPSRRLRRQEATAKHHATQEGEQPGSATSATVRIWYAGCLLALLLALLSKPTAIVTPAVALAIDGLVLRRPWKTAVRWALPLGVLVVPFVVVGRYAQTAEAVDSVAWGHRLLVAGDATGFYLLKLLWPWPLLMDYSRTPAAVIAAGGSIACWVALAVAVIGVALFAKRRPWVAGGAAVFILGFAPVSGLVPFNYQQFSTVADRYVYLALLGPAMIVAIALSRRPRAAVITAAVIAVLAGTVSFVQTGTWRDSYTVARHTLKRNPRSLGAEMTLCYASRRAGDWDQALEHGYAVLKIHPGYTDVHMLLATRLLATRRAAEAAGHFQQAIDHGYGDPSAYAGLAAAMLEQGRLNEAIAAANAVLEVLPEHEQARTTLAYAQAAGGDLETAEQNFRRVLAVHPDSILAARGLQRVQAARGTVR